MKPLPSRRSIEARRRTLLRETTRELAALVDQPDYYYREPWQRVPVDPSVPHSVTLETRPTFPDHRALCTCGVDSGWLPLWDAEQRAAWHRREAEKLHAPGSDRVGDSGLRAVGGQEGAPMLSRTLFTQLARRTDLDLARTPPVVPLPILDDLQPILLVFDQRDLAIEMAYERTPHPGGTRVRSVSSITTDYWVPRLTPVFTVSDGVIVYAAKHGDGHTIVVDHRNDWISVYHRLAHMFVAPSERGRELEIGSGAILGYLGASRSGPLKPLRFELWKHDGADDYEQLDPLRYIRQWRHIRWRDSRPTGSGDDSA